MRSRLASLHWFRILPQGILVHYVSALEIRGIGKARRAHSYRTEERGTFTRGWVIKIKHHREVICDVRCLLTGGCHQEGTCTEHIRTQRYKLEF